MAVTVALHYSHVWILEMQLYIPFAGTAGVHLHPVGGSQLHPDGPVPTEPRRDWKDVHLPQPGYAPCY